MFTRTNLGIPIQEGCFFKVLFWTLCFGLIWDADILKSLTLRMKNYRINKSYRRDYVWWKKHQFIIRYTYVYIIYNKLILQVTKAGYRALLSSCWYLDHLANGGDWKKFYECNPSDFLQFRTEAESEKHKKLLLGGEACMWSEVVNQFNIQSRVWPRASATAEKLWSWHRGDTDEAAGRLEEHTCRMNRRGIAAQPPNGPGFCSPL